jgi:hypothetical protein
MYIHLQLRLSVLEVPLQPTGFTEAFEMRSSLFKPQLKRRNAFMQMNRQI